MTAQRQARRKSLLSERLSLALLFALILPASQPIASAKGLKRQELTRQSSQPCAPNDQSELCQLRRAVSASLDQIETLRKQLTAAQEAIAAQEKTVRDAEAALRANAAEREAAQRVISTAELAIKQQQEIIKTYEGAIRTLTTLVEMTLKRVDVLEAKLDRANGRAARLGIALTIAGIVASVLAQR